MDAVNQTLKEMIIDYSKQLGFSKIGFASYRTLSSEVELLENWAIKGMHSSMNWLLRGIEKREDVRIILSDTKTVIMLGLSYNFRETLNLNGFKISKYAQMIDYHKVISEKLQDLSDFILSQHAESKTKYFVDSGPIMEKQWASLAGIGWQGKNGIIITKDFGSFIFLGTLLCNIEFESDKPQKNNCGTCVRCIEECPTKAIISDKVIDTRKCIAYWTIESKPNQEFPREIIENNPGWIFGCDICQNICPWNNKAKKQTNIELLNTKLMKIAEDCDITKITEDEFNHYFEESPAIRTKYEAIKRNINYIKK